MGIRNAEAAASRAPPGDSLIEEIANTITHGIGAVLSVAGLVFLLLMAAVQDSVQALICAAIYGGSLVVLYLASTLYHAVRWPRWKRIFLALDHIGIFLLIAGTYTPFTLISMGGAVGWTLFVLIWTLAMAGILFRLYDQHRADRLSVPLYLAMGWLVVVAGGELWGALGPGGVVWLVVGGLIYTLGVIFFVWRSLPFNHAVWHLFVIGGSACHFVAVLHYVILPTQG